MYAGFFGNPTNNNFVYSLIQCLNEDIFSFLKEGKNSINILLFRVKYIKNITVNAIAKYSKPLKITEFKQNCHSVFD